MLCLGSGAKPAARGARRISMCCQNVCLLKDRVSEALGNRRVGGHFPPQKNVPAQDQLILSPKM